MTGRVVGFVSVPNRSGVAHDEAGTEHRWNQAQTTYVGAPGKDRVWGIEVEPVRSFSGTIPELIRVYLYDDTSPDCRWVPRRKSEVFRLYRPGDEIGLAAFGTPDPIGAGRQQSLRDVLLLEGINGTVTQQPHRYGAYGLEGSDLGALSRRVTSEIDAFLRINRTASGKLDDTEDQQLGVYLDQLTSALDFEVARTSVDVLDQTASREQRLQRLARLWSLDLGHEVENAVDGKCEVVDFVSRILPPISAQAKFAARLRSAGLPPYRYVGWTATQLGCPVIDGG